MKNTILSVAAFFALSTSAIAQDTLQTMTRLAIDSTLTVGDSASFGSKVTVDDQMTIKGTTEMQQNATARNDLKVEGELYLPNLSSPGETELDILFSDPANGRTYRAEKDYLTSVVYGSKVCSSPNGIYPNPTWSNGPNKIYVECPEIKVGIATANPTHNLTNLGDSKLLGHTWLGSTASIGADNDNFSRLSIRNTTYGAGLHINNSGHTGDYNKLLWLEYTNPSTEIMKVTNSVSNYNAFYLNASGTMVINNGNYNTFDLGSDGTLIMRNATQKTFQFETSGLLRARRVKVDADNWADYVFESDYKLMPLNELKSYVETNKHLPNVPSASEVLANGVDVAEMNKILLEKVEELTVYLLQQNAMSIDLEKQISELKLKIEDLENNK